METEHKDKPQSLEDKKILKKLYFVIYLHWYRKEHHGSVLGIFTQKENAISLLVTNTEGAKQKHVNQQKNFAAVYEFCQPECYQQLEFGMYVIYQTENVSNCKTIDFQLQVTFPVWVYSQPGEQNQPHYVNKLQTQIRKAFQLKILGQSSGELSPSRQFGIYNGKQKICKVRMILAIS